MPSRAFLLSLPDRCRDVELPFYGCWIKLDAILASIGVPFDPRGSRILLHTSMQPAVTADRPVISGQSTSCTLRGAEDMALQRRHQSIVSLEAYLVFPFIDTRFVSYSIVSTI